MDRCTYGSALNPCRLGGIPRGDDASSPRAATHVAVDSGPPRSAQTSSLPLLTPAEDGRAVGILNCMHTTICIQLVSPSPLVDFRPCTARLRRLAGPSSQPLKGPRSRPASSEAASRDGTWHGMARLGLAACDDGGEADPPPQWGPAAKAARLRVRAGAHAVSGRVLQEVRRPALRVAIHAATSAQPG
eukprot:scaffold49_cov409-Prasinococcus_capsulatus_cf.AAC.24